MKSRLFLRLLSVALLPTLPWLSGCSQQSASASTPYLTTTSAPVPLPAQTAPAVVNEPVIPPPEAHPEASPVAAGNLTLSITLSNAPAPAELPAELPPPPSVRVSKALGEVIRLAQAGVDEPVMLTYVTNSPAAFLLGAEEIVYLKDLGVANSIITAMMQRDQTLKTAWAAAAPAPALALATNPEPEPVAVAPSYVNSPAAAVVESQPVVVNNNYFYDTLSPYGSWVEIDGYGRCWRPAVISSRPLWRPYGDGGRWVYTDAGWYWMSDYSWGSVTFHYGRWFNHARWGWCWWPDSVWAPSWVTWRYDNDHCGWAPLPPNSIYTPGVGFAYFGRSVGAGFDFQLGVGSFIFVPWGNFCDPHPYRHYLPAARSTVVFNRATVVNNYERDRNRGVVVNNGIPAERVREHSRTELRQVKIRSEAAPSRSARADRIENGGGTLVVQRPAPLGRGELERQPNGRGRELPRNQERIDASPTPATVVGANPETPRRAEPRRAERPAPIMVNGNPAGGAATGNPVQIEPDPVRRQRPGTAERPREITPEVVRTPAPSAPAPVTPAPSTPAVTPTPVTRPTPIFSKPVVVETRPQLTPARPAPANPTVEVQTVPRSENRSSRISGRDYSVWSTTNPRRETSPASAPTYNQPVANAPTVRSAPVVTAPPVSTPEVSRPSVSTRSEGVSGRSQSIERSSRSEVRPTITINPQPVVVPRTPSPVVTPTPTPAVRPAYTPPAVQPTMSAPRVETRPATPPPSRTETTDSNRGGRR